MAGRIGLTSRRSCFAFNTRNSTSSPLLVSQQQHRRMITMHCSNLSRQRTQPSVGSAMRLMGPSMEIGSSITTNSITNPLMTTSRRWNSFKDKRKIRNNGATKDRFMFDREGRIWRGPIAWRSNRVGTSWSRRRRKKNCLFPLVGRYNKRAKRLVPYHKKQYMRKWELKSYSVWYREHWQHLEEPQPTPEPFQRKSTPGWRAFYHARHPSSPYTNC